MIAGVQVSLTVPYFIQATSTATGTVQVLVDDDLTYQEAGAPEVAGALVSLLNPYDNTRVIATGTTDSTGKVTLPNVPAGPYLLEVTDTGHDSYHASITVIPGILNSQEVFIALDAVTYTWQVQQTTIQDTYQVQLQTTFQTQVPVPEVTLTATMPVLQPGQSTTMPVTITDNGFIAALDLHLILPTDPEYAFTAPLINLGNLPAMDSEVVPVTVTRSATYHVNEPCTLPIAVDWHYLAGAKIPVYHTALAILSIPFRICTAQGVVGEIDGARGGLVAGGGGASSESDPPPQVEDSVYAPIKLQIDQSAVMTRSAFTGTLSISNNETAGPLTNVQVQILVTDANGNPVNNALYISTPTLTGLTAVDGTGSLASGSTGSAVYTLIPTNTAAPDAPTIYEIGGTIAYTDPATGALVTVPLFPSTVTIYPQASLTLNYFLQRDVVGDDPFTPQVEPAEPVSLGLIVTNSGKGTATNLSITSAQPQIVWNPEGLLANFEIIGTKVGAQSVTPSLTVNLGDVAPGQTADAEFILLSSLQGDFTNFTATFSHSDTLGGADTSLISSVVTHTLLHAGAFNYPGSTGAASYLVEDDPNALYTPDTVYLSNGTTAPVNIAANAAAVADGHNTYTVTANVTSGWDYIDLPDPNNSTSLVLGSVVRSDGTVIPVSDMAWTTDRRFGPDGQEIPMRELHIFDLNSTGSYTVTYVINTSPPTSTIAPLPLRENSDTFKVSWQGQAYGGATITGYDIYVSDNGGTPYPLLLDTQQTSTTFTGVEGHTYGFYSLAHDSNGNVQTMQSQPQVVTLVQPASPTTTTLTSSASSITYGQAVTLTAAVFANTGAPNGDVVFYEGNTVLGTAPLDVTGVATFTTQLIAGGNESITAVYTGDPTDLPSTSNALGLTVTAVPSTTSLTISPSSDSYGTTLTLTANLGGTIVGAAQISGSVEFFDGSLLIGTSPITGNVAVYMISSSALVRTL